jgi:hypothetical protein
MKPAPFIVVCLLLAPGGALAQPVETKINVDTFTPTPTKIAVTVEAERYPLSAGQGGWTSALPWKDPTNLEFKSGTLEATFADPDSSAWIPLRLSSGVTAIHIPLRKTATPKCIKANVDIVEKPAADRDRQFRAYLLARDLFYLSGDDVCGSILMPKVVKGWFDRSFALAISYPFVALDRDAVAEARRVMGATYVDPYVKQVEAYELRLLNNRKIASIRSGNFGNAMRLQELIVGKTAKDAGLAKAAEQYEMLTPILLENDGTWIKTLATTAGVKG